MKNAGDVRGAISSLSALSSDCAEEKSTASILSKEESKAPVSPGQFEERLLNRRMLRRLVPVSDMSIWRWEQAGQFPRHLTINSRNFWLLSEVMRWIANHVHRPGSTSDTK
jgi:predicted DNA-binding transcriptional regulator AlpA